MWRSTRYLMFGIVIVITLICYSSIAIVYRKRYFDAALNVCAIKRVLSLYVCVFSFCVFPLDKIVVPLSIVTYTEIRSRARFHHENAIYSHRMLYFPSTISFLHTFSFPIVSSSKLSHAALASLFHTLCQQLLQSTWQFGCGTSDRTDWHQATEFRMHLTKLHSASFRWLHRNDLF